MRWVSVARCRGSWKQSKTWFNFAAKLQALVLTAACSVLNCAHHPARGSGRELALAPPEFRAGPNCYRVRLASAAVQGPLVTWALFLWELNWSVRSACMPPQTRLRRVVCETPARPTNQLEFRYIKILPFNVIFWPTLWISSTYRANKKKKAFVKVCF